jgi:predicted ABC-type transport system involved in lysophospholipase L1 biosynthesis ATPase subunit
MSQQGNLDAAVALACLICSLLSTANRGSTIILVTHDQALRPRVASNPANDGRVVDDTGNAA